MTLKKIKALITDGADINAFDEEYEQSLYEEILDYYIFEGRERQVNLSSLFVLTELFTENNLALNPKPEDRDYFLPNLFRFLSPEKVCVDTFRMILDKGAFSFADLDGAISDAVFDLHIGEYYLFDKTHNYSVEDSTRYFLKLIY